MGTLSETSKEASIRKDLFSDRVKIGKGPGCCQGFYECFGIRKDPIVRSLTLCFQARERGLTNPEWWPLSISLTVSGVVNILGQNCNKGQEHDQGETVVYLCCDV